MGDKVILKHEWIKCSDLLVLAVFLHGRKCSLNTAARETPSKLKLALTEPNLCSEGRVKNTLNQRGAEGGGPQKRVAAK